MNIYILFFESDFLANKTSFRVILNNKIYI